MAVSGSVLEDWIEEVEEEEEEEKISGELACLAACRVYIFIF